MKKTIQKTLSVFLAVVMSLSLCVFAFAADAPSPIVVVSGMGAFPLYLYDENGNVGEQVYGPSAEGIMEVCKDAIMPLAKTALSGDWNDFADGTFDSIYSKLFEVISCDEEGNSRYNVDTIHFPGNVGNYPEYFKNSSNNEDEIAIVKSAIDKVGEENTFFFNYDWRLDPLTHADELAEFIADVKAETGASKVTLIPASMGGTVVNSYLYKYGSDSVDKIIYCLVASKGLDMVGELFGKNIEMTSDMVLERLFNFEKGDILLQALCAVLQTGAEHSGMEKALDKFVANFISSLSDRAYEEILKKSFGYMPGMWAFCPESYYENDKAALLGENANEAFVKKIDEYHYNVQCESENLMKKAQDNGVALYIIASYGYVGFPATSKAFEQSDCLIETKMESFGATCALYGETFASDYEAVGTVCADKSHNHVSTDAIVDASSCAFPEQTWFIKNNKHVGLNYGTDCTKLLGFFISAQSQQTVHSDENYPQFVSLGLQNGKFTSLTGNELKPSILDKHSNLLIRLLSFLSGIIEKIMSLIGA